MDLLLRDRAGLVPLRAGGAMNLHTIRQAIENVRKAGWEVAAGQWLDAQNRCCCPMVALADPEEVLKITCSGAIADWPIAIARLTQLSKEEIEDFSWGFDHPAFDPREGGLRGTGPAIEEEMFTCPLLAGMQIRAEMDRGVL